MGFVKRAHICISQLFYYHNSILTHLHRTEPCVQDMNVCVHNTETFAQSQIGLLSTTHLCSERRSLCLARRHPRPAHRFQPTAVHVSGDCLHHPSYTCIVIALPGKSTTIWDMVTCIPISNCCQCLQAYAIPAYQFDIKLCKTNRPPHSAVRAPGKFESPLIMEHIIEHVAACLNLDPVTVRELNFLKAPPSGACCSEGKKRSPHSA